MINRPKYLSLVLIASLCLCWAACTQERQPCLTPTTASLVTQSIHFASDTATVPVDSSLPHAVFIALSANRAPSGTIYSKASQFVLSLSPDSSVCQWAFTTDSFKHGYDTLTFFYKHSLEFISNACGYTYFYTLDSVGSTNHIIDSLHIINASVTNNAKSTHLKMYIHRNF